MSGKKHIMVGTLEYSSLSEHVYLHLRREMNNGTLTPGSTINISKIAEELGISKTPLRDALIHLECEGFVTILPRKGVLVNKLSIEDVRKAYDAIGLIEAFVIRKSIDKITSAHIEKLEAINQKMTNEIQAGDFTNLFESNLEFHNTYLEISDNDMLKKLILPIKHRLYDFPRHNFIPEWELRNGEEHTQFIECLKKKDGKGAAYILQDIHWSFDVQKEFIFPFYKVS
ncbi:GntR family transcriptional regulator [Desulforhopalus sp. IMCC35007]|uniref:GntR family transcriptional regulator n=1 Tax=Desulforhopalus sp. IMCC35007 TaxID=2569543 RepID=UPI0010ADAD22|nr:GntR family transcriptional regulator [Desulforhopalus sp. IMCC35007]TKB07788.1 GntR family transcriptional regulator [Desulforhopalus sp. IMCC35007]